MDPQLHTTKADWVNLKPVIRPIISRLCCKPYGGLWTSTYTPNEEFPSDWARWSESEDFLFFNRGYILYPASSAKIYTIECMADLRHLVDKFTGNKEIFESIDFAKISNKYDGVHLTDNGFDDTRFNFTSNDFLLETSAWDCESTVWFRDVFEKVEQWDGTDNK